MWEVYTMNYKGIAAWVALICCTSTAMAASPLPAFDKDAVTVHPYQRTGQQYIPIDTNTIDSSHMGNTGTASHPAFYVQKIILDSTTPNPEDTTGTLQNILNAYSQRSVSVDELSKLIADVTEYYRTQGYTVPQAVIPPQEVENGILKIHVYTAKYDTIELVKNESDVKESVLQRYIHSLTTSMICRLSRHGLSWHRARKTARRNWVSKSCGGPYGITTYSSITAAAITPANTATDFIQKSTTRLIWVTKSSSAAC